MNILLSLARQSSGIQGLLDRLDALQRVVEGPELYPDCPAAVTDAVLEAARILDIQFGSFDVIEAAEGNLIIDANSVSNVSEDCTELFGFDLMAAYARALAARYHTLRNATN